MSPGIHVQNGKICLHGSALNREQAEEMIVLIESALAVLMELEKGGR